VTTSPYLETVRLIVSTTMRVPIDRVTVESSYQNLEGWDSLANLALVARLGEDLELEFTDDEIVEMTSVAGILKMLDQKLPRPASQD
jgi:acyl carrier protein